MPQSLIVLNVVGARERRKVHGMREEAGKYINSVCFFKMLLWPDGVATFLVYGEGGGKVYQLRLIL